MVKFKRMSTHDLEMPLCPQSSPKVAPKSEWVSSLPSLQLAAGAALLLGGIIVYFSCDFTWCNEVLECSNMDSNVSSSYHYLSMCVIAPLLVAELINLARAYSEAQKPHIAITSLPSKWQVSLLMCFVFSFVLFTEAMCTTAQVLVHAAAQEGAMELWRPVYSLRYMEWFVSVPILLIISGHFCLGRPMSEVMGPVFLTNVYIFLTWEAFVVESLYLSRMLVGISFALYGWASYDMLLWATSFLHMAPGNFPAQQLRAGMIVGLVGIFGVYGLVCLLAITGLIGASMEQVCYTIGDVGVKTTFCIGLTAIRAMDAQHTLAVSFSHITRQSNVLMSLLRGSFDIVMECTLDSQGNCWLPSSETADLRKLEHWLKRSAAGGALNQLLDGPDQQKRFRSYVLGAVHRSDISSVSEHGVAQVINCALASTSGDGVASPQAAVIHLSGVSSTSMADMADTGRTAFIAMCISPCEEEVPLAEVQDDIGKNWPSVQPHITSRVISTGSLSVSEMSECAISEVSFLSQPLLVKQKSSSLRYGSGGSLKPVLEQVHEASSSKESMKPELIDRCVQTDEEVAVPVACPPKPPASVFAGSHPPQCPAPRGSDTCEEDPNLKKWRERKEKKRAERVNKRSSMAMKYPSQASSASSYCSGNGSQRGYSSYNSDLEGGVPLQPANVVNQRSPETSVWHSQELDAREETRRSWTSPTDDLPMLLLHPPLD